MKIDLDEDNMCTYKEVDIGVAANKELRTATVTDSVKMNFKMECRKYLVQSINQLFFKVA